MTCHLVTPARRKARPKDGQAGCLLWVGLINKEGAVGGSIFTPMPGYPACQHELNASGLSWRDWGVEGSECLLLLHKTRV